MSDTPTTEPTDSNRSTEPETSIHSTTIETLPQRPLSLAEVETVRKGLERIHAEVEIWIDEGPRMLTIDRGIYSITSKKYTILEFVAESNESYQIWRYEVEPVGGEWRRFEPFKKSNSEGDLLNKMIESEDYDPLDDVIERERSNT